jgi:hypothetical protein
MRGIQRIFIELPVTKDETTADDVGCGMNDRFLCKKKRLQSRPIGL